MSTKITVIGEENKTEAPKKPIELLYAWVTPTTAKQTNAEAREYNYVELIAKGYLNGFDLIFCYDSPENRGYGCAFVGHWNDGVV